MGLWSCSYRRQTRFLTCTLLRRGVQLSFMMHAPDLSSFTTGGSCYPSWFLAIMSSHKDDASKLIDYRRNPN